MVNITRIIILFSLVFLSCNAFSVQLGNLYNASVAVPSQDPSDRSFALKEALDQVLVRLTGDEQLILGDHIQSQIGAADSYVLSFGYRENPDYAAYLEELARRETLSEAMELQLSQTDELADTESTVEIGLEMESDLELQVSKDELDEPLEVPDQFLLDAVFAESALRKRMQELALPIWGRSRPSILLWVVRADSDGERFVVGASEIDQYLPGLSMQADLRGVPLYIPVADLTDLSLIDVDGLWGLFSDSHIDASQRYNPDAVVIMRLQESQIDIVSEGLEIDPVTQQEQVGDAVVDKPASRLAVDWQLFIGEQTFFGEVSGEFKQVSSDLVALLAKQVSSQYAVSGEQVSDFFKVEILGINNFNDYVGVQRYLEELAPVTSVEMISAENDRLFFSVVLRDTRDMFYQHLALGRKLIKVDELIVEPAIEDFLVEPVHKFVWQAEN